ncbi:hypothetical protein AGJ34_22185 [Cronobacter dublinensis subsp. dublinensis]|nr:hypothetical protein [Cronobacter dublinensis subsp. dublinensis]EGT5729689.1 hypothetical protein [Cronobacter dublinensis subsp. dublinensis]
MLDAVINTFFIQWFHSAEKERTGLDDWCPPEENEIGYAEYLIRKESAWAAWVARKDYPMMTKKAVSLPEEMYIFLAKVREARLAEINNSRPPAIQRDLFTNAVRCLGDYLIRHDIAGCADSLCQARDVQETSNA